MRTNNIINTKTVKEMSETNEFKEFAERYEKMDGSLDSVMENGYSLKELHAAFMLIQDSDNWKSEIKTVIYKEDYDLCNAACIHFTGGGLRILVDEDDAQLYVYSEGYYHHIGA